MKRVMGDIFRFVGMLFFNVIVNLESVWVKKGTFVLIDLTK